MSIANHIARAFIVLLAVVAVGSCQKERPLAPGQVWSYDTRAREGASTIEILHIERGTPLGDVYFVSVRALNVQRTTRKIRSTEIWPLVFTEQALKESLTQYQWGQVVDRPYIKQLDLWLKDSRSGQAASRTFNIPIKDALDQIDNEEREADKKRFAEV